MTTWRERLLIEHFDHHAPTRRTRIALKQTVSRPCECDEARVFCSKSRRRVKRRIGSCRQASQSMQVESAKRSPGTFFGTRFLGLAMTEPSPAGFPLLLFYTLPIASPR
jgi:hypothetical protein